MAQFVNFPYHSLPRSPESRAQPMSSPPHAHLHATESPLPQRPRSLLDALHRQPAVQVQAAHAGQGQRHALLDRRTAARFSMPSRASGVSMPDTAEPRSRRPSPRSSRRWTTRRPSRWATRPPSRSPTPLVKIAPAGLDRVFFTNSGSEAVDTALKIALAYHRVRGEATRTRLIGRERGYHGVGFGGISVGGISPNRKMWSASLLPGVDHLPHTHDLATERILPRRARSTARTSRKSSSAWSRCTTPSDHCRGHHRAHRGLHRRVDPAAGLSEAHPRNLRPSRHPADLRRGHHRFRPHGLRRSRRRNSP